MKHEIIKYYYFQEIPIDQLNTKKYSIYIIDYNWNYLFANSHAIEKSGGISVIGKNIRSVWEEHPNFRFEPVYNLLKENVDQKKAFDLRSRSPITRKAIEIVGHPLADCYYFSIYELPDKESLIKELQSVLRRR